MNSPYQNLDPRVQKWIFKQGWSDLRDIQKQAISPILSGERDILISAPTAAGKTEAFFLPGCSATADKKEGFGLLYISPLKALINDQCRRLESLCEMLDMCVTPWHGDSQQAKKRKIKNAPSGILLITPESLESLLVREPGWVKMAFQNLHAIVIDEFHAFIGVERGHQLLSLLNRLEHLVERHANPIPRVALSATLGELEKVPLSLRHNQCFPCTIITDSHYRETVKIQLRGYNEPIHVIVNDPREPSEYQMCNDLYRICRGGSHLVFTNSRQRTESIAAQLSDLCEKNIVPNEFFPHHGSLSKELRQELEARLQKEALPTTAICTMTLELGIDIGKVNTVVQITAPHSVTSLRQRLGRSGRRNSPAVLRILIAENDLNVNSSVIDKLRLQLIQSIAMIRLLLGNKWFEPSDTRKMHFSTLLHQVLAVTAQWGGVRADQLYDLLCQSGPFDKITPEHFQQLLFHMGVTELLTQLSSGELVLGIKGERLVNQYGFYAVFKTPEEFRVIVANRTLGTLPVDSLILPDQHIIFGGRRWKVIDIDIEKKVIHVESSHGGKPPRFCGEGMSIHDVVRQEMFSIYCNNEYRITADNNQINFIDENANILFSEGTHFFKESRLKEEIIIQQGQHAYLFPWMGDKIVNTLTVLLVQQGFTASALAGVIAIENTSETCVLDALNKICHLDIPSNAVLAKSIPEKHVEKYDEFLPEKLLNIGYGERAFDSINTKNWLMSKISHSSVKNE